MDLLLALRMGGGGGGSGKSNLVLRVPSEEGPGNTLSLAYS